MRRNVVAKTLFGGGVGAVTARRDADIRSGYGLDVWESKLHLLQCMAYLPVPKSQLPSVESFIRTNLTSDNKFVRAWAYSGFYQLARQVPTLQAEASALFHHALDTETAGSVRSRINRVIKLGF